jgi:hypothetical protein
MAYHPAFMMNIEAEPFSWVMASNGTEEVYPKFQQVVLGFP